MTYIIIKIKKLFTIIIKNNNSYFFNAVAKKNIKWRLSTDNYIINSEINHNNTIVILIKK